MKKILISTGGSGGHVIPAMAFYDHFVDQFEVYISTDKRGAKFINEKKYKYEIIDVPNILSNFDSMLIFVCSNFCVLIRNLSLCSQIIKNVELSSFLVVFVSFYNICVFFLCFGCF